MCSPTPRSTWRTQTEVDGLLNFKTREYKLGKLGGKWVSKFIDCLLKELTTILKMRKAQFLSMLERPSKIGGEE